MTWARSSSRHICGWHGLSILLTLLVAAAACLMTACAGGNSPNRPGLVGNTQVTILLSSGANDQLSEFNIDFNSLTLTSLSGKTVNLLPASQNVEFIHLNGSLESLLTLTVPQDVYTSATATIGGADFTCTTLDSAGGIATSSYAYGATPSSNVTVNLPAPITITGAAMGLLLNMQVYQSATFPSSCYTPDIEPFSITPTFNLTPIVFSSQAANNETGLDGQISSVDAAGTTFNLVLVDGQTLTFNTSNSTTYQGIENFSALVVGMLVDMDAAIRSDGSLLATRIAVEDADTTNLSMSVGPITSVPSSIPVVDTLARLDQGYFASHGQASIAPYYNFSDAVFQISGQLLNLQELPFPATFNSANMFGGQNVYVTTHALQVLGGPTYIPASTITLIPQTIDGVVNEVSSDGAFTTYTVSLAPYDLMPTFAVQDGQTTLLLNPSTVVVYADASTQLLNTQPLAPGSVLRFNGLLFNDSGNMRMDCARIYDGVSLTSQPDAAKQSHLVTGQVKVVRTGNLGPLRQTFRLIMPLP
jgi:hypothetical protein